MRLFPGGFAVAALFVALAGAPAGAQAAEPESQPTPAAKSDQQLDQDFLLLPSADLERVAPPGEKSGETQVGDVIELDLKGFTPNSAETNGWSAKLPPGVTPSLNEQGWDVLDLSASTTGLKMSVVPIRGGQLTLPSLAIADPGGKAVARTNPWNLQVKSAIRKDDPKPQEPAGIRPPVGLEFPVWVLVVLGIVGVALVALLVYGLVRWSRARKARLPPMPAGPPPTEDELALSALAELERAALFKKGGHKKHYFRVSEILKNYVSARYGVDATEATTREMLEMLSASGLIDSRQVQALGALFEHMDLVKFTDHVPVEIEASSIVGTARKFVLETKKRVTVDSLMQGPSGPSFSGSGGKSAL